MDRKLWHTTPQPVDRKRYGTNFFNYLNPLSGFGAFGKGGWASGKGNDTQQIESYDPDKAKRDALYAQLLNVSNVGFPEMQQWGQNYYNQELMPQIREQYETKRNPYGGGFADTPEAAQFATAGRGVTSDIGKLNYDAKLRAMSALSGLLQQPQAYTQAQQPADTLLPALLSGGLGLAGSMYGANQSTKAMKDLLNLYGMGGGLEKSVQPYDYSQWLSGGDDGGDFGMNTLNRWSKK